MTRLGQHARERAAAQHALGQWVSADARHGGELGAYVCDEMRELRFASADGFALTAPCFVARRTLAELHHVTARVSRLVVDVATRLGRGDLSQLAALLGFEHHLVGRIFAGPPSWRWSSLIVRPDLMYSGGVPRLIELNFNSTLSGSTEHDRLDTVCRTAARRFGVPIDGRATGRFARARGRLACDVARRQHVTGAPRILLVHSDRERGRRYASFFDDERERLTRSGFDVSFADAGDVDCDGRSLAVGGRGFDVAFRVYNTETALRLGHDVGLLGALERVHRTAFLASSECLLLTSNALLAMLHESDLRLRPRDRALVDRTVPWTVRMGDRRVTWRGSSHDLATLATSRRRDFVLKPLYGHSGQGVRLGWQTPEGDWQSALEHAAKAGTHCLQERVEPDAFPVAVYDRRRCETTVRRLPGIFGPFQLGRHRGGIGVRFPAPSTNGAVLNWDQGVLYGIVRDTSRARG